MKRYLVFSGLKYYPSGGWGDFHSSYEDRIEAFKCAQQIKAVEGWGTWAHVVDIELMAIVHIQPFDQDK